MEKRPLFSFTGEGARNDFNTGALITNEWRKMQRRTRVHGRPISAQATQWFQLRLPTALKA